MVEKKVVEVTCNDQGYAEILHGLGTRDVVVSGRRTDVEPQAPVSGGTEFIDDNRLGFTTTPGSKWCFTVIG